MEFAGFSTAANMTGIQIKPAALLRELLKQHLQPNKAEWPWPETFTEPDKGFPPELGSPSQPTWKKQEEEVDSTPT